MPLPDPTTLKIDKSDAALYEGPERPGAPCLIVYTGPDPGRRIDLEPGILAIGRAAAAPVRITAPGACGVAERMRVTAAARVFSLHTAAGVVPRGVPCLNAARQLRGAEAAGGITTTVVLPPVLPVAPLAPS